MNITIVFEILLLSYFIYVVGYMVFFTLAARFNYKNVLTDGFFINKNLSAPRFCVLIPAYKEDSVILETAQRALIQSYPPSCFDVVVIADSLQKETIDKLNLLPIKVVEVSFENSTKVKALNKAMEQLPDYDYGVIIDADNVMAQDFLEKMVMLFSTGKYRAIQGQRKPKNQQTTMAFLDGISEAINNTVYRHGNCAAGLSSSISGSGFGVEYALLKEKLAGMNSVGGFDRELEVILLKEGIKVHYANDIVVYDEKVSKANHFQNQRRRWISSQYIYLAKYFKPGMAALFKGEFSFFNSSILRNVQLPRLLNIGLLFLVTVILYFLQPYLYISYAVWPVLFASFAAATFLAIPAEFYSMRLFYAILQLPALFGRMISAFLGMKSANKKFIHTPHEA